MLYKNIMMSCKSCIAGHRASSCQHSDRPLHAIKNKGRGAGPHAPTSSAQQLIFGRGLWDPSLETFRQNMMNDPRLYKEYYHDDKSSSPSPRQHHATPYSRKQQGAVKADDMYVGALSPQQVTLWRQLCGLEPMMTPFFPISEPFVPQLEIACTPTSDNTVSLEEAQASPVIVDNILSLQHFSVPQSFLKDMIVDDFLSAPTNTIDGSFDVVHAHRLLPNITLPNTWSEILGGVEAGISNEDALEPLFTEGVEDEILSSFLNFDD